MTVVLALDLATSSGWSVIRDGETVASGHWQLDAGIATGKAKPPAEARHALIILALRRNLVSAIAEFRPDVVAIERDFGRGAGGRLLACLQNAGHECALTANLPSLSIPLSTWRIAIHGKPAKGAGKRASHWFKAEAKRLAGVDNGDEAEAILIGRYVIANARFRAANTNTKRVPSAPKRRKAA